MLIQNREITHPDVTTLVLAAEEELLVRYPDQQTAPLDPAAKFVVAYVRGEPVGCGAFVSVDQFPAGHGNSIAEVKRMWVRPANRRTGVARRILAALERRMHTAGFDAAILETGVNQPEAISLYEAFGYVPIPAYGIYVDNPTSRCYSKKLSS